MTAEALVGINAEELSECFTTYTINRENVRKTFEEWKNLL
jgi:hypothetical protein